ncbi:MAG: hypothetical protein JXB47_20345 [Anaerolineae bacterium]|nr:hypothetical protein [Anaerolineae bacterium]
MDVNIFNLFVDFPGNLLYFLVVIGVSQMAFFMALDQRLRRPDDAGAGRYAIGAAGMTLAWAALIVGALLTMRGAVVSGAFLPPLERAVTAWIVLFAGWSFLAADARRPAAVHAGMAGLLLLTGAGYAYTGAQWYALAPTQPFNASVFALPWLFVPLILCALGALSALLSYRSARDVPLKLVYFGLVAAGYGVALAQLAAGRLPGDDAGAVRWGMLAAGPVFTAIVYRHVVRKLAARPRRIDEPFRPEKPVVAVKPHDATRPVEVPPFEGFVIANIIQSVEAMLGEGDPQHIPEQVAKTVAATLQADVVAVMAVDAQWADVLAAYDHVHRKPIMGLAINLNEQPVLAQAIDERRQSALLPEVHPNEIIDLYSRLDMDVSGPVYFQPVVENDAARTVKTVLAAAMPYTGRKLDENALLVLKELAPLVAGVMTMAGRVAEAGAKTPAPATPNGAAPYDGEAEAARHELEEARGQIEELTDLVRNLQIELDYERARLAEIGLDEAAALSISQQMEALRLEREDLARERDQLHELLTEAQTTLVTATADGQADVLRAMVEVLTREKRELEAHRDALKAKLDALSAGVSNGADKAALLESLTEETTRLAEERDQLAAELHTVQEELGALGIEGGAAGLAQLLGRLYGERAWLNAKLRALAAERDRLAGERGGTAGGEGRAEMEEQIRRLASDREALGIQRDALRRERDRLALELENAHTRVLVVETEHNRTKDRLTALTKDLQQAVALSRHLEKQRAELGAKFTALDTERNDLVAEVVTLAAERDQLRKSLAGREEELETLSVEMESVTALRDLIADLNRQRTRLEAELQEARAEAEDLRGKFEVVQANLGAAETAVLNAVEEGLLMHRSQMKDSGEVVASTAQELRTPLSSLVGYADLLLSESVGILGAMQRNFLQRIKANSERMATLINDLVQVTALDAGPPMMAPEPVDAIGVIEDAIMSASYQFRERDITLRMNLAENLPPVHADRDLLQQIVTQLLANASLASPPGSEVTLTARRKADNLAMPDGGVCAVDCLFVSVADRGGGVTPEDLERVFRRKYRAEHPLIEGLGDTGVGLSIAKTLVEAHDGRIWAESAPGVGSTFMFTIPIEPLTKPEEPEEGE